jgi:hypothetical protein
MPDFVDVHVHLNVKSADRARAVQEVEQLRERGAHLLVFYREEIAQESATLYRGFLDQVPVTAARVYGVSKGQIDSQLDVWNFLQQSLGSPSWLAFFPQLLFPSLMTRAHIERWHREGCAGVKLAEVRGEIRGAEALDGEALRRGHEEVFAACADLGLPLSLHADLRLHAAWIEDLIARTPKLRVNLAHFGYSRRQAARLLERWPERVFTDTANLATHAAADPDGYARFMQRFPEQVILGSDAFLGDLSAVDLHLQTVRRIAGPQLSDRVTYENPLRFLGRS